MKKIKIYLVGFLLILYFCLVIQGDIILINIQGEKENSDLLSPLTASNSVVLGWYRTWGGSDIDYAGGTTVDMSGNIYLVGTTRSYGAGNYDMVLVKYDKNGMQQWNRTWGGANIEYGEAVTLDSSGNIFLVGWTASYGAGGYDIVIVKYNGNGIQLWNRTWGGGNWERGYEVIVDSSSDILLGGWTASYGAGDYDMVLVKYDENGQQQWNRTWGGGDVDTCNGLVLDSLGNIFLAGMTRTFGVGSDDIVLVKFDENGVQQWNRTWGGEILDNCYEVAVNSLGDIYLVGETNSFGLGGYDIVLVKYDGNGVQLWNRTWGRDGDDIGFDVMLDLSGNVFLAGSTESFGTGIYDMVLVKYDDHGMQQWNHTWGGVDDDFCFGGTIDSSGSIYLAGGTTNFGAGSYDMVLVKYKKETQEKKKVSGYNLLLIISVFCVITTILLKKKYYD